MNLKEENMVKNKGGRPTKKLGERKDYRVNLKLNTSDYYELLAKIKQSACKNISEYVRECIKNSLVKTRINSEQMGWIRKLIGMANNLNQLAYRAHTTGYNSAAQDNLKLANEMDKIIKQIEYDG